MRKERPPEVFVLGQPVQPNSEFRILTLFNGREGVVEGVVTRVINSEPPVLELETERFGLLPIREDQIIDLEPLTPPQEPVYFGLEHIE